MAKNIPGSDQIRLRTAEAKDLANSISNLSQKFHKFSGDTSKVGKALNNVDGVMNSLVFSTNKLNIGLSAVATGGIGLLVGSINRVYELQERWAKIIGETNKQLGKFSGGIGQASKAINKANVQMQGLTDQFGEGAQMMTKMIVVMGTLDKTTLKFAATMGMQLARGYNMGEEGAARFMNSAKNMGLSLADTQKEIGNLTKTASKFNVPINVVTKNMAEANDFMTEFGPAGRKSFTMAAIHLQRFNISMKAAQKLIQHFDTLPDAVESVAKLNIAFGTSLNALEQMSANDPGKVFEDIRNAMIAQGKTTQNLTRQESLLLQQTLGLNSEEIASMLDRKKANMSLDEIRKESMKNQMKEQNAQKLMQKQLQATATTLFSFTRAFDRITVAIGKAINPLLVALGLAKDGSKDFKSFGQVMGSLTNVFVRFFESLAKNKTWKSWMEAIADQMKKLFKWATSLTTSDFGKFFDTALGYAEKFWRYTKWIVGAWAGFKGLSLVKSGIGLLGGAGSGLLTTKKVMDSSGAFPGEIYKKGLTTGGKMLAGGAIGGLAGAGVGHLMGATEGGGIGGGIGGALGSLAGPLGMAIGSVAGSLIGASIQKYVLNADRGASTSGFYGDRQKKIDKMALKNESLQKNVELIQERINIKRKLELENTGYLAENLMKMNISTGILPKRMAELSNGAIATSKEINILKTKSQNYWEKLDKLANKTADMIGLTDEANRIQRQKTLLENQESLLSNKKEQALNSLKLSGQGDLADKIQKEGFSKVFEEISGRQGQNKTKARDLSIDIARLSKEQPNSWGKALIKEKEKELKQLEQKISKDEKFFKVTEDIRKSESAGLRLKQQMFELDEKLFEQNLLKAQLMDAPELTRLISVAGGVDKLQNSILKYGLSSENQELLKNLHNTSTAIKNMNVQAISPKPTSFNGGDATSLSTNYAKGQGSPATSGGIVKHVIEFSGDAGRVLLEKGARHANSGH